MINTFTHPARIFWPWRKQIMHVTAPEASPCQPEQADSEGKKKPTTAGGGRLPAVTLRAGSGSSMAVGCTLPPPTILPTGCACWWQCWLFQPLPPPGMWLLAFAGRGLAPACSLPAPKSLLQLINYSRAWRSVSSWCRGGKPSLPGDPRSAVGASPCDCPHPP